MKKLLIFCMAILLASVPVSTVNASTLTTQSIQMDNGDYLKIDSNGVLSEATLENETYFFSPDATSMHTTITMNYQGQVIPNTSVTVTRVIDGNTYVGTVYLTTFRYLDGITTATYEGTLYLQSSASIS